MKNILVSLAFLFAVKGFSFPEGPTQNKCHPDLSSFGGGDLFPWSSAKPFPWTSIQGRWVTADPNMANMQFQFQVTRTTESVKQLSVEIFDGSNCGEKPLQGIGLILNSQKNVVKVFFNGYMMKLALFRSSDLPLDSKTPACTKNLLGATLYTVEDDAESSEDEPAYKITDTRSLLLKKISTKPNYKCKK